MSCLSWRHIFHESWENKSKFQIGGLRETGGLPLFSPEGRTYSPPRRGGGIACGNRALCEADAAPAGALCPMPHHICAAVIGHAVGCLFRFTAKQGAEQNRSAPTPPARIKLPPAALFAVMGIACRNTHFLFAKKKQKQGRKDGENEWRFTT